VNNTSTRKEFPHPLGNCVTILPSQPFWCVQSYQILCFFCCRSVEPLYAYNHAGYYDTPRHTDASSRRRLAGRFFCRWGSEGAPLAFLAERYSRRWAVFQSALESQPENTLCSRGGWASILRKICLAVAFLTLRSFWLADEID
jgi:hypothetical protein